MNKEFREGLGFTKEDWDAVDSPELTDEQLAGLKPLSEFDLELYARIRRARGRPAVAAPKQQISLRLDPDVIEKFKATGKGWQARINDVLKAAKLD
ncbi:BrnA antitoxin family protein [Devosia rhizoryzae]|uniref:BrnA antitoxin family protein n=1 Tax=Devosia rhizoryzae TaxID=2774137 RepID=A0ABX7CDL0_9HYPH|nr:BrnA antitoxin family protein [Devosia rhizoryzae]QQR40887.1 BrnA antitoxin family protein [Devosia rhizoryzae]